MTALALEARVAVLGKLKESLTRQRDNLRGYLRVLDEQKRAVQSRDMERFCVHVDLEQGAIRDITALQRAIVPLRDLLVLSRDAEESEVARLEESVERLRRRAVERNRENRLLLQGHMETVRNQITSLKSNIRARSPFSDIGVPTLVDIRT